MRSPGLSVGPDGALLRQGRPFRGIGVNYFDVFYRTLQDPNDRSYDMGFAELEAHHIPFCRFMASGFWPAEMKLYRQDKAAYFRRLDSVVRSAERHQIGLIPSLFWNMNTVPDLVGESCDQWGNPGSKTREWMRTYTREIVTRYRGSAAIWGWEFGNEYNLAADLPNAAEHRPAIVPTLGTPDHRSSRDELTHAMIRNAFAAFAREVRRYDPDRIIETGDAFPRPSAWHQLHEKGWTADTPEQAAEMLAGDAPDPVDVISVHAYGDYARIPLTLEIARRLKKALFVGEFGVPGPQTPTSRMQFAAMLELIVQQDVPLAAVWVYNHRGDEQYGITTHNDRAYQLDLIEVANQRMMSPHA